MVICSVSEPTHGADQPPGLAIDKQSAGTPDMPPGLSRSKTHPAEPSGSPGKAAVANGAHDAAAASNAVTTAADTLLNSGAAGPPAAQDTEKQLRNLRKKIRQADATAKKAAAGEHLTSEEEEKLKKLAFWYALQCVGHSDSGCCKHSIEFSVLAHICCLLLSNAFSPACMLPQHDVCTTLHCRPSQDGTAQFGLSFIFCHSVELLMAFI